MKFKTQRIEDEWNSPEIKEKLRDIIELGERFSLIEFGKELTLTDLIRTQSEQDAIYQDNPRYQEKPWKSVHQYGRGCDLRVWDYSEDEIKRLESFFNTLTYDKNRPNKKTCLVHDVGKGKHFHVQVL